MKTYVLLLVLCLFVISPVSAQQDEAIDCTTAALAEALAAGGTINLPADCILELTDFLPEIVADVTINGNGATIDGSGDFIFRVTGAELTVRELTLKDASTLGSGPAIGVEGGSLTMDSCTVENSTASQIGGGLYLKESTATIHNSIFRDLEARAEYNGGGAIFMADSNLTITESSFVNNNAQRAGGGAITANSSTLIVRDSLFEGNSAVKNGGAVSISPDSHLTLEAVTFRNNTTEWEGGALHTRADGSITNCLFLANEAETSGGAIHMMGGELTMTSSTLVGNIAPRAGAITTYGSLLRLEQNVIAGNEGEEQLRLLGRDITEFLDYNLIGQESLSPPAPETTILTTAHGLSIDDEGLLIIDPDAPLIDAVPPENCATEVDMLGVERPQGAGCDIGALEQ